MSESVTALLHAAIDLVSARLDQDPALRADCEAMLATGNFPTVRRDLDLLPGVECFIVIKSSG